MRILLSAASDGELLKSLESDGYEVFLTTDQNLRYQQDLFGRKLGIVVLMSTSWPRIQQRIPELQKAVEEVLGGGYLEVEVS